MKRTLAILALLCPVAFGQTATRYDLPALMTTPGGSPAGVAPALLAVKNATISVCSYPATLVSGMCTNTITTYTDATEGTSCPPSAQLTMPGSTSCTAFTDLQGNLGFWYDPVTNPHVVYTVRSKWGTFGPFDITTVATTPSGVYLPLTGGKLTGVSSFQPANPVFGTPTSNDSTGFYGAPSWAGTTAGPLTSNITYSPFRYSASNSRPGVNRGGWALTAPNWTTSQLLSINYDNWGQGLSNGSMGQFHRGLGDSLLLYLYDSSNGGAVLPDDEGTGAFSAFTGEGASPSFSAATYSGTVVSGGSGATQLTTTCSANCQTQGDGEYLLDLTSGATDYFTAHTNSSSNTPETITTNGTYTVSTAWGSLVANVNTPTTNPVGTGTVSETFNVTLTSGTFTVGGLACFAGQIHDQGTVTAVGTPSGGVQSITVSMRQVHYAGSMVYEGGPCGKYLVMTAGIGDGLKYPIDVFGATGAHTLVIGAFGTNSSWVPNYVLTNVDLNSIGVSTLSNSGTTVTFTFTQGGFSNYAGPFFGASAITIAGASDSAFNTPCTSLTLNSSTQVGTCTIAGLTGTHTAASATVTLGSTGSGNTNFTLYSGAQILDVQDAAASNAVDGLAFTLEPNNAAWAASDSIEAEHLPGAIFFAGKTSVTVHNPHPYALQGLSATVAGAGAVSTSGITLPLYGILSGTNSEAWSNYQYFGGNAVPLPGLNITGPNNGILLRDSPCWGCYALHVGPPHSGTSDAGYFTKWAWDCAAGECGLQFWPELNAFIDINISSGTWKFNSIYQNNGGWKKVLDAGNEAGGGTYVVTQDVNSGVTANAIPAYSTTTGKVAPSTLTTSTVCQTNGTNCPVTSTIGNATLAAGTATITTSAACTVSSTCAYTLTNCGVGGTQGMLSVGTITAGTSFVINSSSATDTSKVCWSILP